MDRLFELFVVVWVALRDTYFPFWVIRSCMFDAIPLSGGNPTAIRVFTGLLCVLQCMHVYWTYLIFRIAYRQIVHGIIDDNREEDD